MVRRLALAIAVSATLLTGASAQARMLDLSDAARVGDAAAEKWITEQPVGRQVTVQLEAEGLKENAARQVTSAIDKRAAADLRRFAATLEGRTLDPDEIAATMAGYLKVLRYNVQSNPRGYASGRPLAYTVTDAEAQRIARGLPATWIEHERPLRAKLDELSMMGELDTRDFAAVRSLARSMAIANAKTILAGMRGASFWSAADAEYYVESSIDETIDRVFAEKLSDAATRAAFIDEAHSAVPTRDAGPFGFNGEREDAAPSAAPAKNAVATRAGRSR